LDKHLQDRKRRINVRADKGYSLLDVDNVDPTPTKRKYFYPVATTPPTPIEKIYLPSRSVESSALPEGTRIGNILFHIVIFNYVV
jgi:hypothetical protein